ncbi:MAG: SAVED domain-containing protein [Acidobacteriota bacterium]
MQDYDFRTRALFKSDHPGAEREQALSGLQGDLGSRLFQAFSKGDIGTAFQRCLSRLDSDRNVGLRVRIAWSPNKSSLNAIAAAPWELIRRPQSGDFLSRRSRFPVSRFLQGMTPITQLKVNGPLKILIVTSQPTDISPVDAKQEELDIHRAFRKRHDVEVTSESPILERVRDRIADDGINVLHFIGHGNFDPSTSEGTVVFTNKKGLATRWAGDMFAEYVTDLPSLRMVVLSSCYGAALPRLNGQDPFLTIAPSLLQRAEIPAVVAMQFPLSNLAATTFARRFYQRIAVGTPVDVAACEGRLAIHALRSTPSRLEWPLPVVFMRVEDGHILQPSGATDSEARTNATVTNEDSALDSRQEVGRGLRSSPPRSAAIKVGIRLSSNAVEFPPQSRFDHIFEFDEPSPKRGDAAPPLGNLTAIAQQAEVCLAPLAINQRPIALEIQAPWSVAFSAGWALRAKSAVDLRVHSQRPDGTKVWFALDTPPPEGSLWELDSRTLERGVPDVALVASVSENVSENVEYFLETTGAPSVGRLIYANCHPVPGPEALRSGAHARRLAQQLAQVIRQRTPAETHGWLHLFVAAPAAFSLFLGQLAPSFGPLRLYRQRRIPGRAEFDFEAHVDLRP